MRQAETITNALYKGNVEGLAELNVHEIKETLSGATVVEILAEADMTMLKMAMKAKCFPTEGEYVEKLCIKNKFINHKIISADAIRIISAGGFYVNQKKSQNIAELVTRGIHVLKNGITILRVGKRNFYIVKWLY